MDRALEVPEMGCEGREKLLHAATKAHSEETKQITGAGVIF